MSDGELLKRVIKTLFTIAIIILACRFTKGAAALAVALFGGFFAMQGKADKFLMCYLLLPFMIILNPLVLGANGTFYVFVRVSNYLLIGMSVLRGVVGGAGALPLPVRLLFVYLFVACLSSATGWFPKISYLKIANFLLFLTGLYCASRDMQRSDRVLHHIRVTFLSFAVIVFWGSVFVLPFPAIAYLTTARRMIESVGFSEANAVIGAQEGMRLFAGILNHSQTLGPLSVSFAVWVLCDMLLVMRRFSKIHLSILMVAPVVFYMTRSRTAIASFVMALFILFFYAVNKVQIGAAIKAKVRRMFMVFLGVLVMAAIGTELHSQTMSRWLRKQDDVAGDQRSMMEAMTSSRMGKIEILMQDFYRNPLLGMGFQVDETLPFRYQEGSAGLLSASVEKGNVFVTVLSETGLIGGCVFFAFLFSFYSTCLRYGYMALMTMMSCFLAANLGECVFFSPTAMGGILWLCTAVGGFAIDLIVIRMRQYEMQMAGFRG